MKRAILGLALLAGSVVFAGCGFVFVARSQPYYGYRTTPAYCYDCHNWPAHAVYSRCSHFEIRVVDGGYYYRPYHHSHHEEYRYAKFSGSGHEKNIRADQNQEKSRRARR